MTFIARVGAARRRSVLASLCALLAAALVAAPSALADPFATQTQLSDSGSLEESSLDAEDAQAAYGKGRTLVVWEQDLQVPQSESIYKRIYGRFVDGTGAPLGPAFAITSRPGGADVNEEFPDVAYDAAQDQFLVVFSDDEEEFVGAQRIAADGSRVGDVITIYDLDARQTRVAWSSASNRFLVVFDDGSTIEGRLVDSAGAPMGAGTTTVATGEAPDDPDVSYDPVSDRWLVAFSDIDGTDSIFGQLVDRDLGLVGARLTIAQDGASFSDPAVAGNAVDGGFRVAFVADQQLFLRGTVEAPSLVFVQAVDRAGAVAGDPIAASNGGEDLELSGPAIAHDARANEFLVTWEQERSNQKSRALQPGEREIFGQRLSAAGAQLGTDDAQVSSHPEGAGEGSYGGEDPAVAYDASTCTYVAAWEGDVTPDGKEEVFDRPWDAPDCASPPAVQAPVAQAQPSKATALRACVSRRAFPIRLVRHKGVRYRSAVVRVNGRKVDVLTGARLRAAVVLTGLPKGRFTVSITARTTKGKTMKAVRRYRTCDRKLPPSNKLGRKGTL